MAILAYDHTALVEPSLLIPGKKPIGPVEIDQDHWIAPYLTHVFLNPRINLVNNKQPTRVGDVQDVARLGDLWFWLGNNGYFSFDMDQGRFGSEEATVIYEWENYSTSNSESGHHEFYSGVNLGALHTFGGTIYENAFGTSRNLSTAPSVTITDPNIYAVTSKSGTNNMNIVEGLPRRSLSITASATRAGWGMSDTGYIGISPKAGTSYDWLGWIKHAYIFNKAFSLDELNEINKDPYQFLIPIG